MEFLSFDPFENVTLELDGRVIVENHLGVVTGSAERAVAVIKALIESPDRRQQIGICAHNYGLKNHSAATVVKLFEDALVNK
jgi:hypothetical protein